jgi:hypothetical protein
MKLSGAGISKAIVLGDANTENPLLVNLDVSEKEIIPRVRDSLAFWEDFGIAIVVFSGDADTIGYEDALLLSKTASKQGIPLIYADKKGVSDYFTENAVDWFKKKRLVVIGDVECHGNENCEEIFEAGGVIEFDSVEEIENAFADVFGPDSVDTGISVFVNPKDILPEYCEEDNLGEFNFKERYCKNSLIVPYYSSLFEPEIYFIKTGPAPGLLAGIEKQEEFDELINRVDFSEDKLPEAEGILDEVVALYTESIDIASDVLNEIERIEAEKDVSSSLKILIASEKAIPHGPEQPLETEDGLILNSFDNIYFGGNFVRINGRSPTDISIKLARALQDIRKEHWGEEGSQA